MNTRFLPKKTNLIISVAMLCLVIIITGFVYYNYEQNSIVNNKYKELKNVSDFKSQQLYSFIKEQKATLKIVSSSTFFANGIKEFLHSPSDVNLKIDIVDRLKPIFEEQKFENIILTDETGKLLLAVKPGIKDLSEFTISKIKQAAATEKIVFSDLYFCNLHNEIHLDFIAPIVDEQSKVIAALIFRINPEEEFFPLLQYYPESSISLETILRKDEDSVLFISETRFGSNTAFKLKIPLTRKEVPAVQAVMGNLGQFEGKDYRGVKVLSDIRKLTDPEWIMITKIDKSEINAELLEKTYYILAICLGLIFTVSLGFVWFYNQRQKNIYEELYKKEKEIGQHQERFKVTMESLGEGIITTDVNGKIRYLNLKAEKLTGWNLREAKGRMLSEIYHVKNEETGQIENNILDKVIKHGIVKELANHTILISREGKEIPVMVTGAPIFNTDSSVNGIVITFHDEAEKRAQQKLIKDNEEKYRFLSAQFEAILDHIPGLVFYKDTKNNFIRVNRYFAEANKTTKEAFENKNCADIYPKEIADKYYEDDLSIINSGVAELNIEEPWLTETGARWVNTNKIPFVDNEGNIIGIIGLSFDITERKKVEKELLTSEGKYRDLIENATVGVYSSNLKGEVLFVNKRFADILEAESPEELKNSAAIVLYKNPEDRNRFIRLLKENGIVTNFETELITRKGNTISTLVSAKLEEEILTGMVLDITELKKVQDKLSESINRFNRLVSKLNDVVWTASIDSSEITDVNDSLEDIYGITIDEFKANPKLWIEMVHPDDREIAEASSKELYEKGQASAEYRIVKPDGTVTWLFDRKSIIYDDNEKPISIGGIAKDITECKLAVEEIIKAKEKAEEINRLKSNFFANMSHELRTPFVGIIGYAEILAENLQNTEDGEFADAILESSQRMIRTLNQILDTSKLEFEERIIEKRWLEVDILIERVYKNYLKNAEKKNLEFRKNIVPNNYLIFTDGELLEQIISNLVSNAIKYTPQGSVSISADIIKKNTTDVLRIEVKDTGIGIPKNQHDVIWKQFGQVSEGLSRSFEGTGLGLSIVKANAKLLGGNIPLESEKGEGSIFVFEMPLVKSVNSKSETSANNTIAAERSGNSKEKSGVHKKILYIEDDKASRDVITRFLLNKYDIVTKDSADESLQIVNETKFDAILMDINLGNGLNGIEVSQLIKKEPGYQNIPIIAVTAFASDDDKTEFLSKGMTHYISKPFRQNELLDLLNNVFAE